MQRYYTRACNFYFGNQSKILVNKKKSIPLHQIKEISFDHVEIITRKKIRRISINQVKMLPNNLKKKINAEKLTRLENIKLPKNFKYEKILSISSEGRQKLKETKPQTVGQASRISGVSPSDISVLLVHLGR